MMNDIPWKLLEKHFDNISDSDLHNQVKKWIDIAHENTMIYNQLQEYFKLDGHLPVNFSPDVAKAKEKMDQALLGKGFVKPRKLNIIRHIWKAAAVLVIGCLSWWLVNNQINTPLTEYAIAYTSDSIHSTITLADGSKVWLNSHSSIKYPKTFKAKREVYLEGEAYFEVVHDAKHTFVVHAGKTQTKVLGTKFNIKASSADSAIAISLIEGNVSFGLKSSDDIFLNPGQQGIYDIKRGSLVKEQNNNPNFMAWKTRMFYFDQLSLHNVFETLSEIYDFKYQFDNDTIKMKVLTANFYQRPLDEIMQTIALSADVKITLQNEIYQVQ